MRERTNTGRVGAMLLLGLVSFLGLALFFVARALRSPAADAPSSELARAARTEPTPTTTEPLERPAHVDSPAPAAPEAANPPNSRSTDGGALVVSVASANGEPWTGAFELWLEHVPRLGTRSLHPAVYTRHVGAQARVEPLPAGDYALHVRAPGRRSTDARVTLSERAVTTTRAVLENAGTLRGRLLDGATPLDSIAVRLRAKDLRGADTTITDAEGRFTFESVLEGPCMLEVGPPNDPLVKDWAIDLRGTELDLGDRSLPNLATLHVLVRDPQGRPVPNARVTDGETTGHFDLATDEHGEAHARHLPPRQYRVFADHTDHGRTNRPIQLEPGAAATLELTLPR